MLILLLLMIVFLKICCDVLRIIRHIYCRIKINTLLDGINTKKDLLYMHSQDYISLIKEIFRRKGYSVDVTNKCGEYKNGLILDKKQFVEVMKHPINHVMEVETAMKLARCMQTVAVFRGMLVTLGDFKKSTRLYCHRYAIECIDGDRLLSMCREVQKKKGLLQKGYDI
jgi:restriction system protein